MTQSQIEWIISPANGLLVYFTTDDKFYAYVASTGSWKEISFGDGAILPAVSCGSSVIVIHLAESIAPVDKTVSYGTVYTDLSGIDKFRITQDLGADQQALLKNDNSETSAGWYWQFNRLQGYKHDGTALTPFWTMTSIHETADWLSENDPSTQEFGKGWRIPTSTEWINVDTNGGWDNWDETYSSVLKLHAAGCLLTDWVLYKGVLEANIGAVRKTLIIAVTA